jgi:nucleotide-binding universal stress UspA family protein
MKILIAYDGSSCADLALEDMRRAGLPRLAEAVVLSVSELWMPVLESAGAGAAPIVGALPVSLEKAESLARRACERVQAYFPEWVVKAEARSGSPASVVIERADEWRPDLIVVGSHGRSAPGRFMLGSVSQKVVTEAHCSARVARVRNLDAQTPARLLISAAAYLGSAAYREVQQARSLNERQDRRLAQLEEQISRNSRQLGDLAQSNQELLANLSLPTKLSNDFNNGVCLISGSYVFIDPNTGLPLRGMKKLMDESGEVEQPQLTTGGDSEIAELKGPGKIHGFLHDQRRRFGLIPRDQWIDGVDGQSRRADSPHGDSR